MKTLKITVLIPVIFIGIITPSFASWWNPTTWKVFTKKSNSVVQNIDMATTIESTLLSCNGLKYKKCLDGQTFVCPTDGRDAYCEKNKINEIKIPKIKETSVVSPVTTKNIKTESVQKPKVEVKESTIDKSSTNSRVITNTNSPTLNTNTDSIYDTNNIMDKDGNAIVITQVPNYKFSRIVTATRGGIKGFFYKDKNAFFTDKELDDQAKASQDASDREFGRGIYAPTAPSAPVYDANKAAQDKQTKLNAVNLEIANLNAKYAEDVRNVHKNAQPGTTSANAEMQLNALARIYQEDYNLLQAKYQQIKYSN